MNKIMWERTTLKGELTVKILEDKNILLGSKNIQDNVLTISSLEELDEMIKLLILTRDRLTRIE